MNKILLLDTNIQKKLVTVLTKTLAIVYIIIENSAFF